MSKHAPLGEQAQEVIDQLNAHARGAAKRENAAVAALAQAESTIQSFKDRLANARAELAAIRAAQGEPVYFVTTGPGPDCEFVKIETEDGRNVSVESTTPHPANLRLWRTGPLYRSAKLARKGGA